MPTSCPTIALLLGAMATTSVVAQMPSAPVNVPGYAVELTPLPPGTFPTPTRLPLEVDMEAAESFVRIGFGRHLPGGRNFQSTEFLTPLLSTGQAARLIEMVADYRTFQGKPVAAAVRRLAGRVSGIQFGREGSPVVYIDLPHWTSQREGPLSQESAVRISDDEHRNFVEELQAVFVRDLGAKEFSADRIRPRLIRVWWR